MGFGEITTGLGSIFGGGTTGVADGINTIFGDNSTISQTASTVSSGLGVLGDLLNQGGDASTPPSSSAVIASIGAVGGPYGLAVAGLASFLKGSLNIDPISDALNVIKTGKLANWGASGDWNANLKRLETEVMPVLKDRLERLDHTNGWNMMSQISGLLGYQIAHYEDNLKHHSKAPITKEVNQRTIDALKKLRENFEIGVVSAMENAGAIVKRTPKTRDAHNLKDRNTVKQITYSIKITKAQWDKMKTVVKKLTGSTGTVTAPSVPKAPIAPVVSKPSTPSKFSPNDDKSTDPKGSNLFAWGILGAIVLVVFKFGKKIFK